MSLNKKILLVGGEDVFKRLDLAKHLVAEQNSDVYFCGSGSKDICQNDGFQFFEISLNRRLNFFSDFRTVLQLIGIIQKTKPDIVHFFDTKLCFLGPISTFLVGNSSLKVVRTITGMGKIFSKYSLKNRILEVIYVLLHKIASVRVDVTIFQNDSDKDYFENNIMTDNHQTALIFGSGITVDDETTKDWAPAISLHVKKEFNFLCVSRMIEEKGIHTLISAFGQLNPQNCKLTLAGPCYPIEPHGLTAEELNADENVNYMGVISDVNSVMLEADVFVYPTSYREGVPRAVMEAMAIGLPILATPAPGLTELIDRSGGGKLVEPNVNDLSLALQQFIHLTTQELSDMGNKGRHFVSQHCSTDTIFSEIVTVYDRITPSG